MLKSCGDCQTPNSLIITEMSRHAVVELTRLDNGHRHEMKCTAGLTVIMLE